MVHQAGCWPRLPPGQRLDHKQQPIPLLSKICNLAPEQFDQKPASPLSDIFSLAVVTYEALTLRRPFEGSSDFEIINSIQKLSPPPASELNHNVGYPISQVVHKGLAKQPENRFSSAKEFGEALEKAMRNEPLGYFDSAKIKPRLDRAAKSFEQGDYEFASEVLAELEAEGQIDRDVARAHDYFGRTGVKKELSVV